jgi:DNA invertase Pin-like site-specific DNA recombinase
MKFAVQQKQKKIAEKRYLAIQMYAHECAEKGDPQSQAAIAKRFRCSPSTVFKALSYQFGQVKDNER